MKILLTGGGSGGHFYPIIAVAEELNILANENHLLQPELYFMSTESYNEGLLYENNLKFVPVSTGKMRVNPSVASIFKNFFDLFKTFFGTLGAIWTIYKIYPDVIFGKGAYASFPAMFAARILRIPVVIHESDTVPGRVNAWAGKFAQKIAVSYPESAKYFPAGKTAWTGNPIRKDLMLPLSFGTKDFLKLEENIPTILVLCGSQGAQLINEIIMDALPELVSKYQIIHQTGKKNLAIMKETAEIILGKNPHKDRYKPFDYLDLLQERMAAGAADVIISRAGSTIFEIASWQKPSLIIPITNSNGDHQRQNAYAYARVGAAEVIEEKNLTSHIVVSEIERILGNPAIVEKMKKAAGEFARRDSAKLIAQQILSIALEHEK